MKYLTVITVITIGAMLAMVACHIAACISAFGAQKNIVYRPIGCFGGRTPQMYTFIKGCTDYRSDVEKDIEKMNRKCLPLMYRQAQPRASPRT